MVSSSDLIFAEARGLRSPSNFLKIFAPFINLNISKKLVAGFATIALAAILVGVAGLYFIDRINNTLNNISDVAAPTVETSDDLIALIFEATKVAEEIIADDGTHRMEPLIDELSVLDQKFDETYLELQSLVSDVSLLDELETARQEQSEFNEHALQMISVLKHALDKERQETRLLTAFDHAGSELTQLLDVVAEKNEFQMAKAEEEGDRLAALGADGHSVNGVLGQLFDEDYPVVEAALKMQRLIIELQDTAGEYVAERNPENLGSIESEFLSLYEGVDPHLLVLKNLTETQKDQGDVEELKSRLETLVNIAHGAGQLFDTHRATLEAKNQSRLLGDRLEADADNAVAALDQVAESADAISDGADEAAELAVDQARTTILTLLIVAIIGSVGLLSFIVLTVIRPIKNLTGEMVSLGERYGSTVPPISKRGDEVTQLRITFAQLQEQVQQRTDQLDSANRDLEQELVRRESLERQLVHTQKLDSLGTLAGGIAHDFNNMLYVILGCTKIALEDLPKESLINKLVSKIDQAAQRSKSIVDQILFFSRREQPNREPLDINQAVRESVTLLRAGLPSTMLLDMEIDDNCGIVLADETQIQQLTVNLITNAYQSYTDGKGSIRLAITRTQVDHAFAEKHLGLRPGPYVRLTVADHGCGIPDDVLLKIYDPFFTTKPVGEGTGLGLSVVHGIVTGHEGVIVISTRVGQGTAFEVYLPVFGGQRLESGGTLSSVM